jgi:predicted CXXCH cytochrome family protein
VIVKRQSVAGRRIVAALLVAVAGVAGGYWLLRSPVADVPDEVRDEVTSAGPMPAPIEAPARPSARHGGYLGSEACAECHAEIAAEYQSHPMSRSIARVNTASRIESFEDDVTFLAPPSTRTDYRLRYGVEPGADCDYHFEQVIAPDGQVVADQKAPVEFAVGSGMRGRSYLVNRDGLMFMSPISWYSATNRWDLSPSYELNNLHFERRVFDGCLTCHAGQMAVVEGRSNCYDPDQPFREAAIGCERCHGPGEQHVRRHHGLAEAQAADPIVNPTDLEPRQRDAVCFQCHLTGERRIPRYGRGEFDFRPGDDLIDIWTAYVSGTGVAGDQTTEAVSQVEQMMSSRCYRESSGRLGCISCHDPHSTPAPEERVGFYRQRCLSCHGAVDPECGLPLEERRLANAEDSCVECHMPRIAANDVPHTSQTDHRVLARIASAPSSGTSVELAIFGDYPGALSDAERNRALGMLLVSLAEKSSKFRVHVLDAIQRLQPWVSAVPDDEIAAEALGIAYKLNNDLGAAYRIWRTILDSNPHNERVLSRLLECCDSTGHQDEALEYARRLVELNPWNHEYHGRLAHILAQQGELEEAIREGELAVSLNPSDYWLRGWLAEVYRQAGRPEQADEHDRAYRLLKPRPRE